MPAPAGTADDLTAWFTEVLREAGHLGDGQVAEVSTEVVGTGQLGSMVRATLRPRSSRPSVATRCSRR